MAKRAFENPEDVAQAIVHIISQSISADEAARRILEETGIAVEIEVYGTDDPRHDVQRIVDELQPHLRLNKPVRVTLSRHADVPRVLRLIVPVPEKPAPPPTAPSKTKSKSKRPPGRKSDDLPPRKRHRASIRRKSKK